MGLESVTKKKWEMAKEEYTPEKVMIIEIEEQIRQINLKEEVIKLREKYHNPKTH